MHEVRGHVVLEDDGDAVHGAQAGRSLGVFALLGVVCILLAGRFVKNGIQFHDRIDRIGSLRTVARPLSGMHRHIFTQAHLVLYQRMMIKQDDKRRR